MRCLVVSRLNSVKQKKRYTSLSLNYKTKNSKNSLNQIKKETMKKIILTIAAVASLINISKAQENVTDFREKLLFGLKVGANYSNVYDAQGEAFHADPKVGLAAGAFLAIPIGRYLGIQPEVLFSQKGFQ